MGNSQRMSSTTILVMKITGMTIVALCVALVSISCRDSGADEGSQVVAKVNGTPITERQLVERLRYGPGPKVLLRMIDEQLITAEAARRGIKPTPQQIELKLSQAASRFGSEEDLKEMLRTQGHSLAELKDRLRLDAILDQIATAQITIEDSQIKQYYQEHLDQFSHGEQVRARMILTEVRQNAEALKEALDSGGDFAGLARQFSIDPATKDQGGDMGYFERGDYAEQITEVAFSLKPGQTSEVFAVPDGFCILRVEERRPAGVKPLEDVRDQIIARLKHKQRDKARQEWLIKQRKQARITIPDRRLRELVQGLSEVAPPPNPLEF